MDYPIFVAVHDGGEDLSNDFGRHFLGKCAHVNDLVEEFATLAEFSD
jgi:hypothetical protein